MTNGEIIPLLQTAVGPVILISGVGLLLLTMTNRLARTVDRARALGAREGEARKRSQDQLSLLLRRARLLRRSILLISASALCSATLVMVIFVTALLGASIGWLICLLFVAAMGFLIGSLVHFIRDVNLSLAALHLELDPR